MQQELERLGREDAEGREGPRFLHMIEAATNAAAAAIKSDTLGLRTWWKAQPTPEEQDALRDWKCIRDGVSHDREAIKGRKRDYFCLHNARVRENKIRRLQTLQMSKRRYAFTPSQLVEETSGAPITNRSS